MLKKKVKQMESFRNYLLLTWLILKWICQRMKLVKWKRGKLLLAEQFRKITDYLVEQFCQITHYLVEQFRQIAHYFQAKNFLNPKFFWPNIFLGQQFLWTHNFFRLWQLFGPTFFWIWISLNCVVEQKQITHICMQLMGSREKLIKNVPGWWFCAFIMGIKQQQQ